MIGLSGSIVFGSASERIQRKHFKTSVKSDRIRRQTPENLTFLFNSDFLNLQGWMLASFGPQGQIWLDSDLLNFLRWTLIC